MPSLPISPYAVAKQAAEGYCRSFSNVYDLETVSLRYFNVFGPRQDPLSQYAAVIPNFITAFLQDEAPIIFGDGEQTRDFTYIDNVVQANLKAADAAEASGQVYNVALGERISLNHVVELLGQIFDREVEPVYAPARPGDVRDSLADISRAQCDLGYAPDVHFEEGLRRTVEFQRTQAPSMAARVSV
jgi:UDP-glucose 4-epimerase